MLVPIVRKCTLSGAREIAKSGQRASILPVLDVLDKVCSSHDLIWKALGLAYSYRIAGIFVGANFCMISQKAENFYFHTR